jgi:hypothetical protein
MAANVMKLVAVKPDGSTIANTPSLQRPAEKRCTTCNAQDQPGNPLMVCGQCRGAWYCSEDCADLNANRHRKLCFKYKTVKRPDGGNQARVVLFLADKQKPEINFVDVNNWDANAEQIVCADATIPADAPVVTLTLPVNPFIRRELSFDLKIIFRACRVPLNTAVTFCYNDTRELPVPRMPWTGSIAVVRVAQATGIAEDLTMADFKDILDFFAWYGHNFTPEVFTYLHEYAMPDDVGPVRGVLIRCPATQALHPEEGGALVSAMVDHLHPIRGLHTVDGVKVGEICQRSAQLNNPLRAFIVPHPPLKTGQGRWECLDGDTSNKLAAELMVDMAAYAAAPMPPAQVSQFIPDIEGDVLLVREDDDHLAVDDVAALCRDVQGWMASVTQGQQQPAQENNHQQQHANAVGGAHPPQVWQDDRTIPCLRTRVKRSGGWDNLAAAILLRGSLFTSPHTCMRLM